jgi:hypothetical protein
MSYHPDLPLSCLFQAPRGAGQLNHFGQYVMLGLRVPNADIPAYFLMVKR